MDMQGSWEDHLPLIEFVYNNSYHSSVQMAPYEALYGRPCRSPLCWTEVGDKALLGPDLVRETSEQVEVIRQRLKTAQSRQKSYADKRRRPLEFAVGDRVFLRVAPRHGVQRFGRKGKLSPRYVGPFEILKRIGEVAYQLDLPQALERVHSTFHVSMLRKYEPDPSHVISFEGIEVSEDLTFEEAPVKILERRTQELRRKSIPLLRVL